MSILVITMSLICILCAIGYIVTMIKKSVVTHSAIYVEPVLQDRQGNQGKRRSEKEYVENGYAIVKDGQYKKIILTFSEQFSDNKNEIKIERNEYV